MISSIPSKDVPTDEAAEAPTIRKRLSEAVSKLPVEQREVFLLRQVSGLSFREIAETVDIPENTVKSRMRYALEKLRSEAHLTLVCGQGKWEDGNIEDTQAFAQILESKGIPHSCDMWGHDVSHEWTWWRRQARHHLGSYLPPPPR